MTKTEAMRITRQQSVLMQLGFTMADAASLFERRKRVCTITITWAAPRSTVLQPRGDVLFAIRIRSH